MRRPNSTASPPSTSTPRAAPAYPSGLRPDEPEARVVDTVAAGPGSRSRCAAQTIGLLLPGAAAQATAARRSVRADVRVTSVTTRKVSVRPAGRPADHAI